MTECGARQRPWGAAPALGVWGALASCLPMVAMTPAGFAAVLSPHRSVGLASCGLAVVRVAWTESGGRCAEYQDQHPVQA